MERSQRIDNSSAFQITASDRKPGETMNWTVEQLLKMLKDYKMYLVNSHASMKSITEVQQLISAVMSSYAGLVNNPSIDTATKFLNNMLQLKGVMKRTAEDWAKQLNMPLDVATNIKQLIDPVIKGVLDAATAGAGGPIDIGAGFIRETIEHVLPIVVPSTAHQLAERIKFANNPDNGAHWAALNEVRQQFASSVNSLVGLAGLQNSTIQVYANYAAHLLSAAEKIVDKADRLSGSIMGHYTQ